MTIFDLLEKYRWDAKVVLVLAAYATSYGEFWLILQLYPQNPLAVLVAMLKQFPKDINALKPRFKALSLVVKTMIAMTKFIITFEGLPIRYLQLNDDQTISTTKSIVFLAAYWITRTALICSSHIRNLIALKPEQVHVLSLPLTLIHIDIDFSIYLLSYLILINFMLLINLLKNTTDVIGI